MGRRMEARERKNDGPDELGAAKSFEVWLAGMVRVIVLNNGSGLLLVLGHFVHGEEVVGFMDLNASTCSPLER